MSKSQCNMLVVFAGVLPVEVPKFGGSPAAWSRNLYQCFVLGGSERIVVTLMRTVDDVPRADKRLPHTGCGDILDLGSGEGDSGVTQLNKSSPRRKGI